MTESKVTKHGLCKWPVRGRAGKDGAGQGGAGQGEGYLDGRVNGRPLRVAALLPDVAFDVGQRPVAAHQRGHVPGRQ